MEKQGLKKTNKKKTIFKINIFLFLISLFRNVNAYYVALYDYDAADERDLSFSKGDRLFVINEKDGWYFGKNNSGKEGIFPSNFVEKQ